MSINSPNNTPQQPPIQTQAPKKAAYAPSYNAVQINLDTPTLNAPQPGYFYDYPKADGQPYYQPANTTPAQQPPANAPTDTKVPEPAVEQKPAQPAQADEPKAPAQDATADVNAMVAGLSDPDPDKQAMAMNEIAEKGLKDEAAIVPYVQEEVINKLINIMDVDSSKLAGPTEQQLQIRTKLAENDAAVEKAEQEGKDPKSVQLPNQVTPEEETLGRSLSPLEQAERNKEYALFSMALLQKTYGDEIEHRSGDVVPLTDLPGAATVVDTLKNDPNPSTRVAAIDALRFIKRPEYNNDLTTLFTIAQNDADENVAAAAKDALGSLNQPENAQAQPATQAEQAAQPAADQSAQPAAEQPAQPAEQQTAQQPTEQPKA